MELPILNYLPLQDGPRRIVLQFLRKPHPTAVIIKFLRFERHDAQDSMSDEEFGHESFIPACLIIRGYGIRMRDLSTWPPAFVTRHRATPYADFHRRNGVWNLGFRYDDQTGEPWHESDDEVEAESEDLSDEHGSESESEEVSEENDTDSDTSASDGAGF